MVAGSNEWHDVVDFEEMFSFPDHGLDASDSRKQSIGSGGKTRSTDSGLKGASAHVKEAGDGFDEFGIIDTEENEQHGGFGRMSVTLSNVPPTPGSSPIDSKVAGVPEDVDATNIFDCQTDSDSEFDVPPWEMLSPQPLRSGSSMSMRVNLLEQNSPPHRAAVRSVSIGDGGLQVSDNFVPDEQAMAEAQRCLEQAEEDHQRNKSSRKEEKKSLELHETIVMKSHGIEKEPTVTDDPFISGIFSTNTPRDITAGIVSGVKNVSKGVALGLASLVVCPVVGGHQGGVGGFFKGVGAGVLGAVTLPATGVSIAGYQIGRGAVNTPNAVRQALHGKKWDKKTGTWKENWYSLEDEAKEVAAAVKQRLDVVEQEKQETTDKGRVSVRGDVVDTEYYEILGVSTTATQSEIKRQYYKLAKKYHPDKTGDRSSAETFTKLGEAYQVLGDEDRRAMYDRHGKSACDEMPILDSSLLFMMLFGSDDLEPYIGKLRMALYMELEVNFNGKLPTEADFEVAQWDREVKVALSLKELVRPYVYGDLERWYAALVETASKLCKNSFTIEIVSTIGWTYKNIARRYIGKWDTFMGIGGKVAKFQEQSKTFGKSVKTFTSMIKTAVAERSVQHSNRGGEEENLVNDEYMKNVCERSLPRIINAMLNICLLDIQSTVKNAARRIVKDMGVDHKLRRKRAEGLGLMGRAFMVAAKDAKEKLTRQDKPSSVYEMFVDAAEKMQTRGPRHHSTSSYAYKNDDDGFF